VIVGRSTINTIEKLPLKLTSKIFREFVSYEIQSDETTSKYQKIKFI